VQYRAKSAHYDCSVSRINHVQTPGCRSVKAAGVDELVARRLLAALAPEEIALALAAAEEVSERRARSDRALEALARDVPALWAADSTSEKDRKRLLRALIADVTITSQPASREVSVGIRWRTGAAEQHTIQRPASVNDATRTPPETVELITRLAQQRTNTEIAVELNAAGLRTGKGLPFDGHAVRHIRRARHIPATPLPHPGGLTVDEVAERLGISPGVIYDWISHNKLAAHRDPGNRLRIPFDPAIEQDCRERIANSSHIPQTKIAATGGAV
jgi:excisionase family DNA binding protein